MVVLHSDAARCFLNSAGPHFQDCSPTIPSNMQELVQDTAMLTKPPQASASLTQGYPQGGMAMIGTRCGLTTLGSTCYLRC